jgi:hypothetical protein
MTKTEKTALETIVGSKAENSAGRRRPCAAAALAANE